MIGYVCMYYRREYPRDHWYVLGGFARPLAVGMGWAGLVMGWDGMGWCRDGMGWPHRGQRIFKKYFSIFCGVSGSSPPDCNHVRWPHGTGFGRCCRPCGRSLNRRLWAGAGDFAGENSELSEINEHANAISYLFGNDGRGESGGHGKGEEWRRGLTTARKDGSRVKGTNDWEADAALVITVDYESVLVT